MQTFVTWITAALTLFTGGVAPASQLGAAAAAMPPPSQPVQMVSTSTTIIQQPIVRTINNTYRTTTPLPNDLVHEDDLAQRLALIEAHIATQLHERDSLVVPLQQQVAAGGSYPQLGALIAASQVSSFNSSGGGGGGGSVSASSITGTITNAINSALATIGSLTGTSLVVTNATSTNATTTNLSIAGTASLEALTSCSGTSALSTDAAGNIVCLPVSGGVAAAGGSNTQVQFNGSGVLTGASNFTFNSTTGTFSVTNASTTALSAYNGLYVGRTATTTIDSNGNISVAGNTSLANATSSNFAITGVTNALLKTNSSGSIVPAIAGTDYVIASQLFAYLFPGNATSTLLSFNGGLTSYASTTIGNGTATGGLTVSGGATTTGNMFVGGDLTLSRSSAPTQGGVYFGTSGQNALNFDGSNYMFTGSGALLTAGSQIIAQSNSNALGIGAKYSAGSGAVFFGGTNSATPDAIFSNAAGTERMRITDSGSVGIGTTSPWGLLSIQSPGSEPLFVSGAGLVTPNLESPSLTLRYANRIFPQARAGSDESAGLYVKVDPTGTNNQLFGIYGEVTNQQQDTEGGLMKTVHYGAGDAFYNAIFSTGIGMESAIFQNGGRGFLGSIQASSSAANSIPFVSLWATSTIPGYGAFYASESPARGLTIQKFATSAPDGYEQIRLVENDLGRNRFAVYNSGSTYLSSLTATSGASIKDSPDLVLEGSNYYYGASASDMHAIMRNVVTATSSNELRFLIGTSTHEALAAILRSNQLDLQSNALVGVGSLTFSSGSILTLSGSAAINQNLQTVDTPTFGGLKTTGSIGVGTTSPWRALSVSGSSDLGTNALAGYFTATTTTASSLPYASTTAVSATTICFTGDTCRTSWPSAGGSLAYLFPSNATTTNLAFNGGFTATNGTTTNLFSSNVTGNTASFGGSATSSFSAAGVLTLATALTALNGGTGQSTVTAGDLLYGSSSNVWSKLGIGGGGTILSVSGGLPVWISTTTLATSITFTQAGVGATPRTLQSKLREIEVSVMDFGAVGDGTTDDTAAIQAAINYVSGLSTATEGAAGRVVAPAGYKFKTTSTITVGTPMALDFRSFVNYTGSSGAAFVVGTSSLSGRNTGFDIYLEGLRATNGNGSAPTRVNSSGSTGIEVRGMQFSKVHVGDVIAFTKYGVYLNGSNDSFAHQHIQDNTIELGQIAYNGIGVFASSTDATSGAVQVNKITAQDVFTNWVNMQIGTSSDNNTNNNIIQIYAMDAPAPGGSALNITGWYNDIHLGYIYGTTTLSSGSVNNRVFAQHTAATGVFVSDTGSGNMVSYMGSNGLRTQSAGFTVNDAGNVGIGTTSPFAMLDVKQPAGQIAAQFVGGIAPTLYPSGYVQFGGGSMSASGYALIGGSIGVGTTTPGSLLSLGDTGANTINISATATSTFGSGINLRTGCFAVNGTCITGGSSGGSFAYLFPSNATTTSLAFNGGFTATNGTTTNLFTSSSLTASAAAFGATATSTFTSAGFLGIGSTTPWGLLSVNASGLSANIPQFVIGSSTATHFLVDQSGSVGIGTTTPGSLFSINSVANFSSATSTIYNNMNVQGTLRLGTAGTYLQGSATSTFTSGINVATGCLAVNGTCIGSGASGSGGGQLIAVFSTSTPSGTATTTVNFNGAANSAPAFSGNTLTLPSNTSYIVAEVWGGGGAGGGSSGAAQGIGGAGAGYARKFYSTLSSAYYYNVGAGGTGSAGDGGKGLTTSFGTGSATTTATGGPGGFADSASVVAAGGTGTNGDLNLTGAGAIDPQGGNGAAGGAGAITSGSNGSTGSAFGGGGSGAPQSFNRFGGNGGSGGLVIYIYTTGVSNGSVGSGTAGQFDFHSAAGTNLSATSSIFLDTTSRIGLFGTTTPWAALSLNTEAGTHMFAIGSSTTSFLVDKYGNVGIATSTPGSLFAINNIANFSTATSSFSATGGINLAAGCFAVRGTCIGSGGSTSAVGGTGAVQFANGTSFSGTSNFLWDNAVTALGLGTSTPKFTLSLASSTNAQLALSDASLTSNAWTFRSAGGVFYLATSSPSTFATSTVAAVTIDRSGNLGVGTSSPSTRLDVAGSINASSGYKANGISGVTATNNAANTTADGGCAGGFSHVTLSGGVGYLGGLATTSSPYVLTTYVNQDCSDGDLAEYYGTIGQKPERGEIVSLTASTTSFTMHVANPAPGEATTSVYTINISNVALASSTARAQILGAVPTTPGYVLSPETKDKIASSTPPQLVALSGHVPVRMTIDGGLIGIGDPITVSTTTPGAGMKALSSGRIVGYALAPYTGPGTGAAGTDMIEVQMMVGDWIAPQDFSTLIALSDFASSTYAGPIVKGAVVDTFFNNLFSHMRTWFDDAGNGIEKIFVKELVATNVTADELDAKTKLCLGATCVTESQLKALLAGAGAASSPPPVPAATTSTATLVLSGNDPVQWDLGTAWADNLGALFTHDGANETIYSTSTIDTTTAGTSTIDYWAYVPSAAEWLHAVRTVVVPETATSTTQ